MRTRPTTRMASLLAVLTLVSGLAACGDDDDDAGTADETAAASTAPATEPATSEPAATEPAATEPAATEPAATEPATTDATATTEAAEAPSGDPIMIAALTSLTGNFAPWGLQVQDGMQLAIDDINAAGGAGGRPLELVVADDQSNADEGLNQFERLVEEGAVAVAGAISSDVGAAVAPLAEESQVPFFAVKAGTPALLTADSRYTFRTCLPSAPMVAGPILQYAQEQGFTKVGAIIADYGWGHAIEAAMQETFADSGIELQIETAPVPEQDFTTYLRNLEAFGPEVIVATGHPPGTGAIVVQSADLGLDVPVTGSYTPLSLVAAGAGDAAIDRYTDFKCNDPESTEYQDLARRYLEMSDNTWMSDDAVAGYGVVTAVAQAIDEVGDDPVAVAEYLHANSFEPPGYAFPLSWTEWGELAEAAPLVVVIGSGPAPEGVNEAGDWYPEVVARPQPLEPFQP
jgi:branched-chain amino acid transport system substrate-binding protein